MNWDEVKANWTLLKGRAPVRWGDITDEEWHSVQGRRENLVGLLQKNRGHAKDAAEREIDDWMKTDLA